MPRMSEAPAKVIELAVSVPQFGPLPPRPIAWAERDTEWVIVFEDGRKLTFEKPSSVTLINPADGIDKAEASAAGKVLNQRRRSRRR